MSNKVVCLIYSSEKMRRKSRRGHSLSRSRGTSNRYDVRTTYRKNEKIKEQVKGQGELKKTYNKKAISRQQVLVCVRARGREVGSALRENKMPRVCTHRWDSGNLYRDCVLITTYVLCFGTLDAKCATLDRGIARQTKVHNPEKTIIKFAEFVIKRSRQSLS